jgi:hypothetical protein
MLCGEPSEIKANRFLMGFLVEVDGGALSGKFKEDSENLGEVFGD